VPAIASACWTVCFSNLTPEEAEMATKKKAAKTSAAGLSTALKFRKEWIFDPPVIFSKLDQSAITRINQLRDDFINKVNATIKQGQR
jgi:hypothetical protein